MRTERRPARAAWAAILVVTCGNALAEELPWQIGADIGAGHEGNVFRAPAGEEVADRYTFASVNGNLNARLGRQHLLADLAVRSTRYGTRHDLDNTGYGVGLAWDGSTVGRVSWHLWYRADRSLASYGTAFADDLRVANNETTRQMGVQAQLGGVARWILSVDLSRRAIDYSAPVYAAQAYELDSIGVAATWEPARPLSVTVRPRLTHGRFPNVVSGGLPAPQAFDRKDLDIAAQWVPSGLSTLNARISATAQHYVEGTERDFDGVTGQLDWNWRPTGKTRIGIFLSRDTGTESSFFTLGAGGRTFRGTGDNSRLTTNLSAQIDYSLTGKVSLVAHAQEARRRLAASSRLIDAGIALGAASDVERTRSVSLGVRYSATARSTAGCDLTREQRAAQAVLSSPYAANVAMCSLQLRMR